MSKKRYYIPGVDSFNQLVETPASKERTEKKRFLATLILSAVAAVASVAGVIISIIALVSA